MCDTISHGSGRDRVAGGLSVAEVAEDAASKPWAESEDGRLTARKIVDHTVKMLADRDDRDTEPSRAVVGSAIKLHDARSKPVGTPGGVAQQLAAQDIFDEACQALRAHRAKPAPAPQQRQPSVDQIMEGIDGLVGRVERLEKLCEMHGLSVARLAEPSQPSDEAIRTFVQGRGWNPDQVGGEEAPMVRFAKAALRTFQPPAEPFDELAANNKWGELNMKHETYTFAAIDLARWAWNHGRGE